MAYQAYNLRDPANVLTPFKAFEIFFRIQNVLWLEGNDVNPDKEHDADSLQAIVDLMTEAGLAPEEK